MLGRRGTQLAALESRWTAPIGDWRSQLLWRAFGVAVNQLCVMLLPTEGLSREPVFIASYASGLLLIALGPRLVLLLFSAIAQTSLLFHIISHPSYQLAEEYLPLAVLPSVGVLLCAIVGSASNETRTRRIDCAQVALFRVTVVALMSFAAFHKLNADFFDPTVSCAMIVPHRLLPFLPGADLIVRATPFLGFAGEALVPLLLIFYPRLGMALTVVVMGTIGHRGATSFTILVLLLSISFLRAGDRDPIREFWRRNRFWIAAGCIGLGAASFVVYQRFGTHRPWHEYLLFELVLVAVSCSVLPLLYTTARTEWAGLRACQRGADRRIWLARVLRPGFSEDPILGFGRGVDDGIGPRVRLLLVVLIGAAVLNAMTPYLGLKLRMSFAMFSNLRVDDDRWNHFLIPRALDLRRHDPYVHVTRVRRSGDASAGLALEPGLYLPDELDARLAAFRKRRVDVDIEFEYRGERRTHEHAQTDAELLSWIARRMGHNRWIHGHLVAGAPQPCLH